MREINAKTLDVAVMAVSLIVLVDAFMPFCRVSFVGGSMFVHLDDIARDFPGARILYILPLINVFTALAFMGKSAPWKKTVYIAVGFLGTVVSFVALKQLMNDNTVIENILFPIAGVHYFPFGFLLVCLFFVIMVICAFSRIRR